LNGTYGGYVGWNGLRADFDLSSAFLVIDRIVLGFDLQTYYSSTPWQMDLTDALMGESEICPDPWHVACVRVGNNTDFLAGKGTISLWIYPPCCDQQAFVSNAALMIDGAPLGAPGGLLGFAEFQVCFGVDFDVDDCCSELDFDDDGDIDLDDFSLQDPLAP